MDDSFTYMSGFRKGMMYFNVHGAKGHRSLDQVSPSEMVETVRSSSSGTRSGRSFFSGNDDSETNRQFMCREKLMEKFCHFSCQI